MRKRKRKKKTRFYSCKKEGGKTNERWEVFPSSSPPRHPPPQRRPSERPHGRAAQVPRVSDAPPSSSPPSPVPPSVDVPPRPRDVLENERSPQQSRRHGHNPPQQHRRRGPREARQRDDAIDGRAGAEGPRGALDAGAAVARWEGAAGPGRGGAVGEGAAVFFKDLSREREREVS